MKQRLLGLFAHPDDELFCVGGTFALAAAAGAATRVVSFTQGGAGQIRHADLATRRTLGTVRAGELERSCTELGIAESHCLTFADGQLRDTDRSTLVEAAVREIRSFKPDTVYSFDHTGAYGHSDHIVMSEVSLEAAMAAGDPTRYPDAGPPHIPAQVLHAVFPQSDQLLLELLVQWLDDLPDRFRGTEDFVNALLMFADGSSMLGYAADQLQVQWFPQGSYIIEQGAEDRQLYLLLAGGVTIVQEGEDGRLMELGRAGVGEFIGETAIAHNARRSAHCIASENTSCFVLSATASDGYRSESDTDSTSSAAVAPAAGSVDGSGDGDSRMLINDVSEAVPRKVKALAAHATQYALTPDLFPLSMMTKLLGVERFLPVWPPTHQPARQ